MRLGQISRQCGEIWKGEVYGCLARLPQFFGQCAGGKVEQCAHDARTNRHGRHHDDEFVPSVCGVQPVKGAQINQGFAGTGFHFHAHIQGLPLLGWCEVEALFADAMALGHRLQVAAELRPSQRAAVACEFVCGAALAALEHICHRFYCV